MGTTSLKPPQPAGGWVDALKTYQPEAGRYDELLDADGTIRPHWRGLLSGMQSMGPEEMALRYRAAESIIAENGMTYNVYGDPRGMDRPWALDLLPVVIPAREWEAIERGVQQRLRLMNALMADLYGPQQLMYEGTLPPEFIFANPHYLRPCRGIVPRNGAYVMRFAADLVRGADGHWQVYNDRSQAPSGAGYALENRIVLSRTFPNLLADMHVRRLAAFFEGFRGTLRALSGNPRDTPTIVLLTPGPHNETYFEHVYLARYLGIPLVEGGDLTVRDNRVYLKTVEGLQQVDGMWRRVDDAYSDPLELIKNSSLGTPGLLQALRAGNLAMCNSVGCAALDVSALKAMLPSLCQRLLGEDLKLQSTRTLWGAVPEHRAEMSARLYDSPLLSAFMPPLASPPTMGELEGGDREALQQLWDRRPYSFVMTDNPKASSVPVMRNGNLEACGLMMRVYATLDANGGCEVMPGGLARFSHTHDPAGITMQSDSGSKDVWVLSDGPVDFISLLSDHDRPLEITRSPQNVPSRLAENLLWLGRYCERTEVVVRFLRYVLLRSSEEEGIRDLSALGSLLRGSPNLFEALATQLATADGEMEELSSEHIEHLHKAVLEAVFNPDFPNSVTSNLLAIRRAAWTVRERFSEDDWRILIGFVQEFLLRQEEGTEIRNCLDALNKLVAGFAAFSGLIVENMTKEPGQAFLDMGRRIERATETADLLAHTLPVLQGAAPPVLRGLLSIFDSPMTYAARYGAQMQEGPVLDLLLADETNPRAVAYQLNILSRHLSVLPKRGMPGLLNVEERIIEHLLAEMRVADMNALARPERDGSRPRLAALLEMLTSEMCRFADEVSLRYFIHTGPARALEPSPEFDPLMQYQVVHTTRYTYGSAVPIAYNRACLMPRSCLQQECLRTLLRVEPMPMAVGAPVKDYYGNEVTYFSVQDPHDTLIVSAQSEVRITPLLSPVPDSTPAWEQVRDELRTWRSFESLEAYQFAFDKEPLNVSNVLREYAEPSFQQGTPILSGAIDLMMRIHRDFSYDPTATTVSTPVEEVFRKRRGVCQDFASMQISCLRALGLAARYVSGYIAPVRAGTGEEFVGSQASHAWLAVYVPGHGWVDLDPTNDILPTNEHITLAWGRYFEEVSPVRGVILGGADQELDVHVEVTRLSG